MALKVPATLSLDQLDLALIGQLQRDGRKGLTALAKDLGVSHGTVRNRLDRLRASGILRVSAVVDPAKIGYPIQVLIGASANLAQLEPAEKELSRLEEVTFVATLTGRFDFLIFAAFASDVHLREFLVHKLSKIKGIRSTETFHTLSLGKRVWQWEVPVRSPALHRHSSIDSRRNSIVRRFRS